jgi:hypothetical protein
VSQAAHEECIFWARLGRNSLFERMVARQSERDVVVGLGRNGGFDAVGKKRERKELQAL